MDSENKKLNIIMVVSMVVFIIAIGLFVYSIEKPENTNAPTPTKIDKTRAVLLPDNNKDVIISRKATVGDSNLPEKTNTVPQTVIYRK